MASPRPLPSATHELNGNPSKKRLNKNEPKPKAEVLPPPAELLDAVAKAKWKQMAAKLAKARLLTTLDEDALLLYCNAFSIWRDAQKQLDKEGVVLRSHNGSPVQNPYVAIRKSAAKEMLDLMREFGSTPSARTGVEMLPTAEDDEVDSFGARRLTIAG